MHTYTMEQFLTFTSDVLYSQLLYNMVLAQVCPNYSFFQIITFTHTHTHTHTHKQWATPCHSKLQCVHTSIHVRALIRVDQSLRSRPITLIICCHGNHYGGKLDIKAVADCVIS